MSFFAAAAVVVVVVDDDDVVDEVDIDVPVAGGATVLGAPAGVLDEEAD